MSPHKIPILYTFRRCPYAIRARMALYTSQIPVEVREIELKNKPQEMLSASPKGTVPVLIKTNGEILEESIDIMLWALDQSDPENWLYQNNSTIQNISLELIAKNDNDFKTKLDRYKYADRFPEKTSDEYRAEGLIFLRELNSLLRKNEFLLSNKPTLADFAIFPFVRQFAHVDKTWFFSQQEFSRLIEWLNHFLLSQEFVHVMKKYKLWVSGIGQVVYLQG